MKTMHVVLAGFLASSINGCSSVPIFSEDDTNALINEISTYSPVAPSTPPHALWIQPSNKSVDCKIFEASSSSTAIDLVLWDGECKSGYAYGLGREMIIKDGNSLSAIAKYPGGKVVPTYYLHTRHGAGKLMVGSPQENSLQLESSSGLSINESATLTTVSVQSDGVVYVNKIFVGEGVTSLIKVYPNGYTVAIKTFTDPAIPLETEFSFFKGPTQIGLSYLKYKNAVVQVVDVSKGTPQLVNPHDSYYAFLNRTHSEITARTNEAKPDIDSAMTMVMAYRTTACAKPHDEFTAFAHYLDICVEEGDFTQFHKVAKKVAAARDERFSRTRIVQQAEAERIRQLQAANAAHQSQQISNMVNSFNQAAEDFNQSSQATLNSVIQNRNTTTQNFGLPAPVKTYCYKTGNITNCKTQ